jgi:WD40 repeat protein
MSICLRCSCGRQLQLKPELAGKRARCPACGTLLAVPARPEKTPSAAEEHVQARPRDKPSGPRAEPGSARRRQRKARRSVLPWVVGSAAAGVLLLAGLVVAIVMILRAPAPQPVISQPVAAAPQLPPVAPPEAPRPENPPQAQPVPVPKPPRERPKPAKPETPVQGQIAVKEFTAPVERVAFSSDGKLLAAATQEQAGNWQRVIHVWDAVTFQERAVLRFQAQTAPQHKQQGHLAIAFSPDGKTLAAVHYSNPGHVPLASQLVLWDLATARERVVVPLKGADPNIYQRSLAYAPDGSLLATLEHERSNIVAQLRAPDTGQVRHSVTWRRTRSSGGFNTNWVGFSANGRTLAAVVWPGPPRFWDVAGQQEVLKVPDFNSAEQRALSPDLKTVVAFGSGWGLQWYDVATGKSLATSTTQNWGQKLSDAAFSPDSRLLAISSPDHGAIKLWDVTQKKELAGLSGHGKGTNSLSFSPDGKLLVSGGEDNTARVWAVVPSPARSEPPKQEAARPQPAKPAQPPQPQVGQDGLPKLLVWKRYFVSGNTPVLGAAFSPDGRYALCGAADGRLRLWYTQTGAEVRHFIGHAGAARAMGFSPDGKRALSCSQDKTIRIWDVASGLELRRLEGHAAAVAVAVFSADGRRILSCGHDQTVCHWDAETGKELKRFEGVQGIDGRTWSVALSPDGRRALSCGQTVQLWDVETGKEIRKVDVHAGEVLAVAFSPDGRSAVSGGTDKTVRLWDVDSGKELRKFAGHADGVRSVAFTPDGHQILTGSYDRTVRLWDVETGKELGRCVEPGGRVVGVAVAPEGPKTLAADAGRHFLASAGDGSMRLLGMADAASRPLPASPVQKRLEQPVCFASSRFEDQHYTLGDMLQELSSYGVKIEVDQKALQAHNWTNVEGVGVRVPPLRGVKLATALRLILDQVGGAVTTEGGPLFLPQVGYVIRGDTVKVTVVPPRRGPPTDESRTSLLTKKLAQVVSLPRGVREDWLSSVLMYDIHERFDLNVVIDTRSINDVLQRKAVKLPPVEKVKLGDVLQQILDQADATYLVKDEYVLVVARRKK